jgi:hypothetical protein
MAQNKQDLRKTLRSALANKKLADTLIDTIYDLQVWAENAGGTIATKIQSENITRSTQTPYLETRSKMKRILRSSLGNKKAADLILNILFELQGYASAVSEITKMICIGEGSLQEISTVNAIGEGSVQEITSIVTRADVAADLDAKYFILEDAAGTVAFWIDVDDDGAVEPAHGCARSVEITTITTGMTAAQVGDAVYAAVIADAKFEAGTNDGAGNLTIKNTEYGVRTLQATGDSGFTVTEQTNGHASNLDGKYFRLEDAAGTVAFWFDVDNDGTLAPVHGCDRAVEITTVTSGMTAAQVGDAIYAAVIADAKFEPGTNDGAGNLTVKNTEYGIMTLQSAGDSGFTVAQQTNGAASALDGKYFKMYDDAGSVAFWFDISDHGTAAPVHGCDRAVEINTVTYGMNASQVGTAVYAAVIADAKFAPGSDGGAGTIYIKNDSAAVANATAGTSGFTVSEFLPGVGDLGDTIIDAAYTVGASPTSATIAKILASKFCHRTYATTFVNMILELQTEFRDGPLGTCSGMLTYPLIG